MKINYLIQIRICSYRNSYSSNDVKMYKLIDEAEYDKLTITKELNLGGKKFYLEEGDIYGDDFYKSISVTDLSYEKKHTISIYNNVKLTNEERKEIIDFYSKFGFKENDSILNKIRSEYLDRYDKQESIKKKELGLVVYDWKNMEPSEYQGGFSNDVFNDPELKRYVGYGSPSGYIGHICRTVELDKILEREFLKYTPEVDLGLNMESLLACWLTSTDGRHFGNSLEDLDIHEQITKIKSYLPNLYHQALIYTQKDHKGTLASTIDIEEKLKSLGMINQTPHSDFSKELSKHKTNSDKMKFLADIVNLKEPTYDYTKQLNLLFDKCNTLNMKTNIFKKGVVRDVHIDILKPQKPKVIYTTLEKLIKDEKLKKEDKKFLLDFIKSEMISIFKVNKQLN